MPPNRKCHQKLISNNYIVKLTEISSKLKCNQNWNVANAGLSNLTPGALHRLNNNNDYNDTDNDKTTTMAYKNIT